MRKILTKLLTLAVIGALCLSSLTGCGLITTNTERDMNQVVATVQISNDVNAEDIKKSEMISGFLSYGHMYVEQYGYTVPAAYEMVLKNLIQNRVIVQQARTELAKTFNKDAVTDFEKYFKDNATNGKDKKLDSKDGSKENLEKYLTEYEIEKAKYAVRTSINGMIDQFVEEDDKDEEVKEDETFTPRKTPTEKKRKEAKYEFELKGNGESAKPTEDELKKADVVLKKGLDTLKTYDLYDLNLSVYKEYKIDFSTKERVRAFNKAIKNLKTNGLIKKDEKDPGIKVNMENPDLAMNYSYFADSLVDQYETAIVGKYEQSLISVVDKNMTVESVADQYMAEYEAQKSNYDGDITAYETALDAVNEEKFVVCNPYKGYGYVANLLIGFTEEQTAELKALASKPGVTDKEIKEARENMLNNLIVKDQRDSWVYAGYGAPLTAENANKDYVFDNKYRTYKGTDHADLYKFNGELFGGKSTEDENEDKVKETKWSYDNVVASSMTFGDFFTNYANPVLGLDNTKIYKDGAASELGKIDGLTADRDNELRQLLDDMLFAFSTDPGSLGNYHGYTYSPYTSSTKFVKEFADASAAVVNAGVGAYTIVATEFGYHIIVCTNIVEKDPYTTRDAVIAALNAEGNNDAKYYREMKFAKVVNDEVSKIANKFINDYMNDETKVVKYHKTYKDLIPEETKDEDSAN